MQWLTTVLLPSISSLDSRGTMKSVVNDSIWHDGEVGVRGHWLKGNQAMLYLNTYPVLKAFVQLLIA